MMINMRNDFSALELIIWYGGDEYIKMLIVV